MGASPVPPENKTETVELNPCFLRYDAIQTTHKSINNTDDAQWHLIPPRSNRLGAKEERLVSSCKLIGRLASGTVVLMSQTGEIAQL